jgi:hypothetical protein
MKKFAITFPLCAATSLWRAGMPNELPRTLRIEIRQDGTWRDHARLENTHRRLIIHPIPETADGLRVISALEVGALDYQAEPGQVAWPVPHWTGDRSLGA